MIEDLHFPLCAICGRPKTRVVIVFDAAGNEVRHFACPRSEDAPPLVDRQIVDFKDAPDSKE